MTSRKRNISLMITTSIMVAVLVLSWESSSSLAFPSAARRPSLMLSPRIRQGGGCRQRPGVSSPRHSSGMRLYSNEDDDRRIDVQTKQDSRKQSSLKHILQRATASTALAISLFLAAPIHESNNNNNAHAETLDAHPSSLPSSSSSSSQTNKALIDYAVGTINTQYYDNSGGAWFNPKDFYLQWKTLQHAADDLELAQTQTSASLSQSDSSQYHLSTSSSFSANGAASVSVPLPKSLRNTHVPKEALQLNTREGTLEALKWLVGTLEDPYSKYMTREELKFEYHGAHDGFLGTGAYVEAPTLSHSWNRDRFVATYDMAGSASASNAERTSTKSNTGSSSGTGGGSNKRHLQKFLSSTRVANLPVVTAVAPNSPAERAGLVVGDRIVAVGDRNFLGWTRPDIAKTLHSQYSAESYLGVADLTIAKPVYAVQQQQQQADLPIKEDGNLLEASSMSSTSPMVASSYFSPREIVLGYRATKLHLPTKSTEPSFLAWPKSSASVGISSSSVAAGISTSTSHGDAVVQYELITSSSGSIFDHLHSNDISPDDYKVGYIRLTRFSKLATEGFQQAVQKLEDAGAQSYIIDLRNNYGGVIQEAMLTASSLLRDPHAILCYLLNARGGFTPVDVEQYVVDPRYPGYLLSKEAKTAVLQQVQREHPSMFRDRSGKVDWDPPSSYASIHEQVTKRNIRRFSYVNDQISQLQQQQQHGSYSTSFNPALRLELQRRKDLVILINEGTASSAEFFTAALHDNGRTVAVVGTKSFGKGLIQHTFPMPDGGGLKLTVGEFLRPSLQHVTNVFDARFDHETGEISGGGIRPDIYCDSKQGIPGKPNADLCVGVALDVLEETAQSSDFRKLIP